MALVELQGGDGLTGWTGQQFRDALNTMLTEIYSKLHTRKHALGGADDHEAAAEADWGKFLAVDLVDGHPVLRFILDGDIPNTIARLAFVVAHIEDYNNPHQVTAEQLGITAPLTYVAGASGGLAVISDEINIEPENLTAADAIGDTDVFIIGVAGAPSSISYALLRETLYSTFTVGSLTRYQSMGINDVYYLAEVLATGPGITCTLAGSTMTVVIPSGVRLVSMRLRVSGYSTLTLDMGTGDMGNSGWANRWAPLCQAWREDTGQPLLACTVTLNTSNFAQFTVNGLASTTTNHIRIGF